MNTETGKIAHEIASLAWLSPLVDTASVDNLEEASLVEVGVLCL